jgi:hypothetical protein
MPSCGTRATAIRLDAGAGDADRDLAGIAWDTDADGAFDDATGSTTSVTYATPGTKTVAARATGLRRAHGHAVRHGLDRRRADDAARSPGGGGPSIVGGPNGGGGPNSGGGATGDGSPRVRARLTLLDAKITRGGRLRLHAAVATRANGRSIRISVRAGGRTRTYHAPVRGGRISFDRKLIAGQVRARKVRVGLRFAGSATVAPATSSITLG